MLPVLKQMALNELAEVTGLSERVVEALKNGHSLPRRERWPRVVGVAGEFVRARLRETDVHPPTDDLSSWLAYLHTAASCSSPPVLNVSVMIPGYDDMTGRGVSPRQAGNPD